MAQTGFTPIQLYSTSTAAASPSASNLTNSTLGSELAINITDGKLFYKDNANAVQVIGWKTVPTTAGGTGLTSYTAGDMLFYASGTALSKLAIGASGRYLSSTGTAPQWSAPAALTETDDTNVTLTLGGSPSTALLSAVSMTLGWTGTLAVSRGGTGAATFTAGQVLFGNGTSAIATDSAFFWDNTNKRLGLGTTPQAILAVNSPGASNGSQDPLVVGQQTNTIYAGMFAVRDGAGDQRGLIFKTWQANVGLIEPVRFFSTGGVSIISGLTIGSASNPSSTFLIGGAVLSSGAGTHFLKWNNSTGLVTYDTSSRLVKTDIEDSPYGLAEILKLKPRKYFRTDDQRIEHGLIADEVVDVMPEYVPMVPKSLLTKDENDTELVPGGVNYERIVAPLINAVQQLQAQIDALKLQIGK